MFVDSSTRDMYSALTKVPIIDTHSHIDPLSPTATSLDDLLGYHYYTELAHSAGLDHAALSRELPPRDRCRAILEKAERFDNTIQFRWLEEIARTFLGFSNDRIRACDADWLFDSAQEKMGKPAWCAELMKQTNLERVFLTNAFDDPLDGFDRDVFVPCLRTDDLVFRWNDPDVHARLQATTGIRPGDMPAMRRCIGRLFERFANADAKACAISLPPSFVPRLATGTLNDADEGLGRAYRDGDDAASAKIFWILAEHCRDFGWPFDLMIGVNRKVYANGVFQGQDLFDVRWSLIQYAELFNAFPSVSFCVSILSSVHNPELVSYSWIFPNVLPHGHWWYSNIPAFIESDLRARITAVPKSKLLGYYSDAYKLEFVLPKYNMYRAVLANVLMAEFVKTHRLSEEGAVELGTHVLRRNGERVFLGK